MKSMKAGVYMTCKKLPSFGKEDDNVKRRLSIYQTKSLKEKVIEAPRWMKDNAFKYLVWMVNTLNRKKSSFSLTKDFTNQMRQNLQMQS